MKYLIDPLLEINDYRNLIEKILASKGNGKYLINGPSESQKAHLAYALSEHIGRRVFYITYNELQAKRLYEDFYSLCNDDVVYLPAKEVVYYNVAAKSNEVSYQRINAMDRILKDDFSIGVASVEALMPILVSPDAFLRYQMKVKPGDEIFLEKTTENFLTMGYERCDIVEAKGQFAIRGGIIDVFPVNLEEPVRIELFGDEVDSLRSYDPLTQRSTGNLDCAYIIPAKEIVLPIIKRKEISRIVRHDMEEHIKRLGDKADSSYKEKLRKNVTGDMDRLEENYHFPGIDRYISHISEGGHNTFDFISTKTLIVFDEPERLMQRAENVLKENDEICKSLIEKGSMFSGNREILYDYQHITDASQSRTGFEIRTNGIKSADSLDIKCAQNTSYNGITELLVTDVKKWEGERKRIVLMTKTGQRALRLRENLLLDDIYADIHSGNNDELVPGKVTILKKSFNLGFQYSHIGLVVISDGEIFGRDKISKRRRGKTRGVDISLFSDLNTGDYVVHQVHGIGQYMGIEQLDISGIRKDYLKIKYQGQDSLYIPTNQLDKIQKYIGAQAGTPRLNKLGGGDWEKVKKRVKESLVKLAQGLVRLYATRNLIKGYAFSQDTIWQSEFEEQFPYEETEDQLKCTEEIKGDMESEKPMDRLLCGDVGYGKTEVALRAAFKAVMESKQVAFLVPTTVLAQQHYVNFVERMKGFPIDVEMISRFKTKAQQKKILEKTKIGAVDILIGTHRLIQKDIEFKDLGLLVIDEEQRFGVSHKETLKEYRPDVDILSLSATPIPRTLHMSLTGIRDISIIEEPPEERYPVQTYVMEYDEDIIRDAIIREMARDGQVFYLYNRVRTIDIKADQLQTLIPEARIGVAHGQMEERRLEETMLSFLNKEFDILVCTTIIESGLDMANVNTLIIEDADKMGLAQLYQLKGRVGRSKRLAYAYITYKKDKILNEVAEKRLQTIMEFTEFGSGFKIAMRDMEIRGAGNLLGGEQHGHIETVGYDMYCRLLEEAVNEVEGKVVKPREDATIDLKVNGYIPSEYIENEKIRLEMYKKIALVNDEADVLDLQDELIDRYAYIPPVVENLVAIALIKSTARDLNIISVNETKDGIVFQLKDENAIKMDTLAKIAGKYKGEILFNAGRSPYILYKKNNLVPKELLYNIKILLQDIKNFDTQGAGVV